MPVKDGFVIGRVAGCDLVIDDTKASRRHARLVVDNGVVEIEDLGSSNGTLLNGKPVTRRVLRGGDVVTIGKSAFTFHEGALPGAKPAAATAAASPFADDDLDLLGDAPAATEVVRVPSPPPAPVASAPPPPPPPPPPRSVVEFADEVVEVRRPAAAPAAKSPAAPASPAPASGGSRILQYNKVAAGSGGLLGDDLGQMGGGMRLLLVLGVLALGAGIVYFVMHLSR